MCVCVCALGSIDSESGLISLVDRFKDIVSFPIRYLATTQSHVQQRSGDETQDAGMETGNDSCDQLTFTEHSWGFIVTSSPAEMAV